MITVTAKNLGPLAEGVVDLKPLTIFVGPSNTGKSYMAAAIWAAAQAFEPDNPRFLPRSSSLRSYLRNYRRTRSGRYQLPDEEAEAVEAIQYWIESSEDPFNDSSGITIADLPEPARLAVDKFTHQLIQRSCETITNKLRQAYGTDSEFSRNGETENFSLTVHRDEPYLKANVRLTDQGNLLPIFDVSNARVSLSEGRNLQRQYEQRHEFHREFSVEILEMFQRVAAETILDGFSPDSYYLPAARSGIVQGHKVLAASVVRQSSFVGLQEMHIPTLPGITTEFLSNLISLDRDMRMRRDTPLRKAIDFIENNVLRGKIDLDESSGLPTPEIVYLPENGGDIKGKFNLEHTSSMVSELAPLILFLKYLVAPGDLLVLEEPESHLHPAAQLRMARGIARLVNAGVRVLITTHSSDLMGQIDNLISLSNVSEETAQSLGFEQEECLSPEQVSAYGFRSDGNTDGSVTYPLQINTDVGIEDEEFLPVSELLYEQAITLQDNRSG